MALVISVRSAGCLSPCYDRPKSLKLVSPFSLYNTLQMMLVLNVLTGDIKTRMFRVTVHVYVAR